MKVKCQCHSPLNRMHFHGESTATARAFQANLPKTTRHKLASNRSRVTEDRLGIKNATIAATGEVSSRTSRRRVVLKRRMQFYGRIRREIRARESRRIHESSTLKPSVNAFDVNLEYLRDVQISRRPKMFRRRSCRSVSVPSGIADKRKYGGKRRDLSRRSGLG
ncbi:hypothetical protein PUN28_017150 [Cardiocondyla obscurior]|uniref:Uncharacterized protein n=1 Tax=Cardiocondyla obscurior TaxID=286306 RepID=A0AAW2ERD9_9HYME